MKSAKRVLAIVMAMLMVIGTCAVAASAAGGPLQALIDAAGDSYQLTKSYVESIVIDGKNGFELDLNGYEIVGDFDLPAITIKNSTDVTIKNGQVQSRMTEYQWPEDTLDAIKAGKSPSAVAVYGGTARLEGLRLDGGRTSTPYVKGFAFPTGSGLQASSGAEVTLNQVSAIGDYAVYNEHADVIVEDAVLVGYLGAAKSALTAAEGTEEEVNAADRIEGYLSNGVTLTENEKSIMRAVFGKRALVYTKTPAIVDVTVTDGNTVDVAVPVESHIWANGAGGLGTDCSYKYIPEALVLENGTTYALANDGEAYSAHIDGETGVTKKAQIRYRLEFVLENDIQDIVAKYDNIDAYYAKAIAAVKKLWDSPNKNDEDFMGAWTYYTRQARDVLTQVLAIYDEAAAVGYNPMENESFAALVKAIFALGGISLEDPKNYQIDVDEDGEPENLWPIVYIDVDEDGKMTPGIDMYSDGTYSYYFGTTEGFDTITGYKNLDNNVYYFGDAVPEGENLQPLYVYGLLDKLSLFVADMDAYVKNIDDNSTFSSIFYWAYANLDNFLAMIPEALEKINDLQTAIDNLNVDMFADKIAAIKDGLSVLNDAVDALEAANNAINGPEGVMNDARVKYALRELAKSDEARLKGYVDKIVGLYNNRDQYFDKDKFIIEDGTVLKAYCVYGEINILEETSGDVNLKLTLDGRGDDASVVVIQRDDKNPITQDKNVKDYLFTETFTLTAEPGNGDEFLYWVNAETNRIFTTEPTLTFSTKIDRKIQAVFQTKDTDENPLATFTNTSGAITAAFPFDPSESTIDYAGLINTEPFLPGYTFTQWGYAVDNSYIDLAAAAADTNNKYKSGNSVFATMNAYYDNAGYALPVRTDSRNYIVMPAYTNGDVVASLTFTDSAASLVYTAEAPYGYYVTVTASDDPTFLYWADANTGEIVCFDRTFKYQSVVNRLDNPKADFIAVYGAGDETAFYASRTAVVVEETDRITLYAERAVKEGYTIKSTGVVFGFGDNTAPKVNEEGVLKGTSKDNSNNGLYVVYITKNRITTGGGKVNFRPYIEIEGLEEPVYGVTKSFTVAG